MSDPRKHLEVIRSDRGFARLPAIAAGYVDDDPDYEPDPRWHGDACVYESSIATGPHLWLKVREPRDRNDPREADSNEATIHLPLAHAEQLAEQIQLLARNHYQLREDGCDD